MLGKTNVKVKPNEKKPLIDYVEYIESTGTQYIDTGFKPNQNTRVVIKYQLVSAPTTNHMALFGQWTSYAMYRMYYHMTNKKYSIQFYQTTYNNLNITVDDNILNIDMDKNVLKVNGVTINTASTGSFNSQISMYLFGSNSSTSGLEWATNGIGRIYSCQIYDNGTLIRDFKPVKDGAGVYCMYDEVEKRYYYNQGTGEFRGEGWEPTQLEYIESSGTQYINTGVVAKLGLKMVCEFELPSYKGTDTDTIFGVWGTNSRYFVGAEKTSHYFQYGYMGNYTSSTKKCELNTKYTVEYDVKSGSQKLVVDGTTLLTGTSTSSISTTQTIYLFNFNSTNASQTPSTLKVYSFKIYENDTLIRDFIPVLDENNVACLFDKISKTCFYNQGSGSFTGGASI